MEAELRAFVKVAALTAASMTYARFASSLTSPGKLRLLSILPTLSVLAFLPHLFSTVHLRLLSGFLLIWLSSFKLVLLSFDFPPLSPSLPLPTFIALSSLPVKPAAAAAAAPSSLLAFVLSQLVKLLVLAAFVSVYDVKHLLPDFLVRCGYGFHLYLSMDLILSSLSLASASLFRVSVYPQFNRPYFSSSLRQFWGRRWNLMATDALRSVVYNPVHGRWGGTAGVMATFTASGVMHEVLFWYLVDEGGTRGEALGFFVAMGMLMLGETEAKARGWWRPGQAAGVAVTLSVVATSAAGLLFAPLVRGGVDVKVVEESAAAVGWLTSGWLGSFRRV